MSSPAGSLAGKVALITGSSRGIGRAAALMLADAGATVAVHYGTSKPQADAVVAEILGRGGAAFAVQADLADRGGPAALFAAFDEELQRRFGTANFDILVNNAGMGSGGVLETVTEDELDRMVQINLKAPFRLIQLASPRLRDGGRIINVSSTAVRVSQPRFVAYAPTKAGLESLTNVLAVHFGPRNITVNTVRPGATATELNIALRDPAYRERVKGMTALGRVGEADDVAEAIAFLASDQARWITGQQQEASGGLRL